MILRVSALVALLAVAGLGCRQDMHDQPKYKPYRQSEFFADGQAMRPFVEGTVARGLLREATPLNTGKSGEDFVTEVPLPVTAELLERGRSEYRVFCSPCHGGLGNGEGMIVQPGFRRPPSFHEDRLKQMPIGHFYDVMSNGFGTMMDYSGRVPPEDRWAIAAYIKSLGVR